MRTRSSSWIQGNHWRPLPSGPPANRRNGSAISLIDAAPRPTTSAVRTATCLVGCRRRLSLPVGAHTREEVGAGRRGLVDGCVTRIAVVADPRRRHEDLGSHIPSLDRCGEGAVRLDAARTDLLLATCRPARAADRSAGQVHDRVGAVDLGRDLLPAARPCSQHGVTWLPGDGDDLVSRAEQRADECFPDQAGPTGDDDLQPALSVLHVRLPPSSFPLRECDCCRSSIARCRQAEL